MATLLKCIHCARGSLALMSSSISTSDVTSGRVGMITSSRSSTEMYRYRRRFLQRNQNRTCVKGMTKLIVRIYDENINTLLTFGSSFRYKKALSVLSANLRIYSTNHKYFTWRSTHALPHAAWGGPRTRWMLSSGAVARLATRGAGHRGTRSGWSQRSQGIQSSGKPGRKNIVLQTVWGFHQNEIVANSA